MILENRKYLTNLGLYILQQSDKLSLILIFTNNKNHCEMHFEQYQIY
jgi:hypothetical protein